MDTSGLVEQVAHVLQRHPDQLRIKKLAFGVCERRWENDPSVLNQRDFISLIHRLLASYRCSEDLRRAVLKVVARLNRQTRYLPLAHFLLDQIEPLYAQAAADEPEMTQFGEFPLEEPTQLDGADAVKAPPAPPPLPQVEPDYPPVNIAVNMAIDEEDEETAFSVAAEPRSGPTGHQQLAAIATHPAATSEMTIGSSASPVASATVEAAQMASAMAEASLSPYAAIARGLERHTEAHRIHKLIYGVCHQTWENDMLRLQSHPLLDLLETLHQQAPSLAYLAVMLNQKAATLNRKLVYMQIAHVICEAMRPIYNHTSSSVLKEAEAAAIATPAPSAPITSTTTQAFTPANSLAQSDATDALSDDRTAPISPAGSPALPADSGWDAVTDSMTQAEWEPAMNSFEQHDMTMPEIHSELLAEGLYEQPISGYDIGSESASLDDDKTFKDRSDLFELRLQIIRYANPLRAKLILFSSLHHTFDFSSQDWLLLKDVTLEDLLRQLFETYHSMDEVDVNLTRAAYALPNAYQKDATVDSLMRSITPYYPADSSVNVA